MHVTQRRPRLLMVTHRVPHPPNCGDRIRTWNTLNQLAADFDIHLACLCDEPVHLQSWRALARLTHTVAIQPLGKARRLLGGAASLLTGGSISEGAFYTASLQKTIDEWVADRAFDAALAVCSSTAGYIEHLPISRKVLDLVDVDSQKWADYAASSRGLGRLLFGLESRRLARTEQRLAGVFQTIALTTEREAELFARIAPAANTIVVPNGVNLPVPTPLPIAPPVAVFTGMLDYRPNVEGISWFAREIWPAVRSAIPAAQLRIVGRSAGEPIRRLAQIPGVRLIGEVDDVQRQLDAAHVAIAPLSIARGVQNKALEAMAAGRPVIVTPAVAAGITGAQHGRELLVADSTAQWIESTKQMLKPNMAATLIGRAARRFVERHHRWDECVSPLVEALLPPKPAVLDIEQPITLARIAHAA
jgi:sugar transferase (PEP-CTERM/EpsH1 system associated)